MYKFKHRRMEFITYATASTTDAGTITTLGVTLTENDITTETSDIMTTTVTEITTISPESTMMSSDLIGSSNAIIIVSTDLSETSSETAATQIATSTLHVIITESPETSATGSDVTTTSEDVTTVSYNIATAYDISTVTETEVAEVLNGTDTSNSPADTTMSESTMSSTDSSTVVTSKTSQVTSELASDMTSQALQMTLEYTSDMTSQNEMTLSSTELIETTSEITYSSHINSESYTSLWSSSSNQLTTGVYQPPGDSGGLSTGAIIGIAVGAVAGVALLCGIVFFIYYRRKKTKNGGSRKSSFSDAGYMHNPTLDATHPTSMYVPHDESYSNPYTPDPTSNESFVIHNVPISGGVSTFLGANLLQKAHAPVEQPINPLQQQHSELTQQQQQQILQQPQHQQQMFQQQQQLPLITQNVLAQQLAQRQQHQQQMIDDLTEERNVVDDLYNLSENLAQDLNRKVVIRASSGVRAEEEVARQKGMSVNMAVQMLEAQAGKHSSSAYAMQNFDYAAAAMPSGHGVAVVIPQNQNRESALDEDFSDDDEFDDVIDTSLAYSQQTNAGFSNSAAYSYDNPTYVPNSPPVVL